MKRLREILRTATLGGVLVVLPTLLLVWIVEWLAQLLGTELAPIAAWLASIFALPDVIAVGAAFGLVVGICFAIGLVVQTDSGAQMVHLLETHLMMRIPGYRTLKDVVQQIGARDERLFSEAVLNDTNVPTPIEDAIANMKVIEAIFRSAERGMWVK